MDLQENVVDTNPIEHLGEEIKDIVEGNASYINEIIDGLSADEFYEKLQTNIVPLALGEYNPKVRLMPLSQPAFVKIRTEMCVAIEYKNGLKAAVIDMPNATVGVAAFDLSSSKRIAILVKSVTNRELEDFKNLRSDPHAHQTIGS